MLQLTDRLLHESLSHQLQSLVRRVHRVVLFCYCAFLLLLVPPSVWILKFQPNMVWGPGIAFFNLAFGMICLRQKRENLHWISVSLNAFVVPIYSVVVFLWYIPICMQTLKTHSGDQLSPIIIASICFSCWMTSDLCYSIMCCTHVYYGYHAFQSALREALESNENTHPSSLERLINDAPFNDDERVDYETCLRSTRLPTNLRQLILAYHKGQVIHAVDIRVCNEETPVQIDTHFENVDTSRCGHFVDYMSLQDSKRILNLNLNHWPVKSPWGLKKLLNST